MHWSGQMRCRVTTLTRYWTDGSNSADLINGFDQVRGVVFYGIVHAATAEVSA
jgi:protein transport protein SEC23